MSIIVEQGGMLTTIQDSGRFGYQGFGMTPAGAMDLRSFRIANLLVGNERNEAALELTMLGPVLRFEEDAVIAVCGADMQPKVNGVPMAMYAAVAVKAGDKLAFSAAKTGCRAYLAVSGGFNIPKEMGSLSTYTRFAIGGVEGRKLQKGDVLPLNGCVLKGSLMERQVEPDTMPDSKGTVEVHVILGPQDDMFTEHGIDTFLTTPYTVTPQSDRMGYRLQGEALEHKDTANIISDGIAFGSVQVPASGQPILMMADHQPTGGYTKIANIISVDLPKVAQCRAGASLKFEQISVADAQKLYCDELKRMNELEQKLQEMDKVLAPDAEVYMACCAALEMARGPRSRGKFEIVSIRELD